MKRQNVQNVLLAAVICLSLLLTGALGWGALQSAFGAAQIVRKASGGSLAYADMESLYTSNHRMLEPPEIYKLASEQTVMIKTDIPGEDGQTENSVYGSGFVISCDGYILTNYHVVSSAKEKALPITVSFFDKTEYQATLVGTDATEDIALLKIDLYWIPAVKQGDSDDIEPCESVFIMGHPAEELAFTMTSGIISALDRTIPFSDGTTLRMFQMDAAVNPGNSGGPVYNIWGEVVGITTAKYASFNTEGLGFAIPINVAMDVAGDLKEYGYVKGRPLMGITVTNAAEDQFEGGSPAGALVYGVEAGLCGEKAGLLKGDIIVKLGDTEVGSIAELTAAKRPYRAGDTVSLKIWRAGEYLGLSITFDEVDLEHPVGNIAIVDEPAEETPEITETPEEPEE